MLPLLLRHRLCHISCWFASNDVGMGANQITVFIFVVYVIFGNLFIFNWCWFFLTTRCVTSRGVGMVSWSYFQWYISGNADIRSLPNRVSYQLFACLPPSSFIAYFLYNQTETKLKPRQRNPFQIKFSRNVNQNNK